jgi:hypothetical protein
MVMNDHRAAVVMVHDDRAAMMVDHHRTAMVNDHLGLFDRRLRLLGPDRTRRDRRGVGQTRHQTERKGDGDDSFLKTF